MSGFVVSTLDICPVTLERAGTLLNALRSEGNAPLAMQHWSHVSVMCSKTERWGVKKQELKSVTHRGPPGWYKARNPFKDRKPDGKGSRNARGPERCWRSQSGAVAHCALERVCKWETEEIKKKGKKTCYFSS